jgi:hypothetical protein
MLADRRRAVGDLPAQQLDRQPLAGLEGLVEDLLLDVIVDALGNDGAHYGSAA